MDGARLVPRVDAMGTLTTTRPREIVPGLQYRGIEVLRKTADGKWVIRHLCCGAERMTTAISIKTRKPGQLCARCSQIGPTAVIEPETKSLEAGAHQWTQLVGWCRRSGGVPGERWVRDYE